MTEIDEQAEEIVLSTQEYQATTHLAHLTATFYRTLVGDGVGRLIARDLTRTWMENQPVGEEDE